MVPVVLVAFAGGAAIAGVPSDVVDDVQSVDIRPPATTGGQVAADDSTAAVATTVAPGAVPATTSTPPPATDARSSTTVTTGATSTSSTGDGPTSSAASTASPAIVVANAARRPGVATAVAERLRGSGYTDVVAADALDEFAETVVYHSAGDEVAAQAVASALGLAATVVQARPEGALTVGDEPGTVWVMLGRDAV